MSSGGGLQLKYLCVYVGSNSTVSRQPALKAFSRSNRAFPKNITGCWGLDHEERGQAEGRGELVNERARKRLILKDIAFSAMYVFVTACFIQSQSMSEVPFLTSVFLAFFFILQSCVHNSKNTDNNEKLNFCLEPQGHFVRGYVFLQERMLGRDTYYWLVWYKTRLEWLCHWGEILHNISHNIFVHF